MRLFLCFITSTILLFSTSCKHPSTPTDLSKQNLIPIPVSVMSTKSSFELTENAIIFVNGDDELMSVGKYLSDKLTVSTGFKLPVKSTNETPGSGNVYLTTRTNDNLGPEGYLLTITEDLIELSATTSMGVFRGLMTIRQLLPAKVELATVQQGPWLIATGVIRDYPSYEWRGTMLDVARHFFSVADVKRYIDLASYYKLNIMHLHLSDDQGWRIEIKSWPNLTKHGGSTQVGGGKGGFYTQEQYSDIVAYAKSRYVTIVPEIDLPGHINSALASYGELNGGTIVPQEGRVTINPAAQDLGAKSKPTELYTGVEVGWSTLRLEKDATFKFVEDVIREISALTPGPYFHIGGDEAHVTKKQDYIIFINRFKEIVKSNGKIMVGWEEISQGNLDKDVVVQYWKQSKYADMAVEKQSKLILSPSNKAYIDMSYDSTSRLGLHWAAYIEVDSAYQWNLSTLLNGMGKESILGVEAPLWSETISTMDELEYLAFPRLPGYAEIGWSPETNRNWDEYKVRLGNHGERMKALGIDFYRSKKIDWKDQ